MKTFKQMRDYFIEALQKKGFYVDNPKYDEDCICFSLSHPVGLSCVYAEISVKEIQHAIDNQDEEDLDDAEKMAYNRDYGEHIESEEEVAAYNKAYNDHLI